MKMYSKFGIVFAILMMSMIGLSQAVPVKLGYACDGGSDATTKCALVCLMYPKFSTGFCGPDGLCYCELKKLE